MSSKSGFNGYKSNKCGLYTRKNWSQVSTYKYVVSISVQLHWSYMQLWRTNELCSKFLLISLARTQSLRRNLRSLTFSKVLLMTQQLQRTSLRSSYGKLSWQTKEWYVSEKHMLGRCFFLTRSGQVRQMRLTNRCFHWLLNCLSLIRVRWHWYVSFCATWQQPC